MEKELKTSSQATTNKIEKQITIMIASKPYPLKISAEDEPVIRKIVKEINEKVNQFQLNYTNKDKQDCLALTLLSYAVDLHKFRQSLTSTNDPEISDRLTQLKSLLDAVL